MSSKLIVIGGLPGTGKTSLATGLAQTLDAVQVRIDTIEQALRASTMSDSVVGPAGYVVAYGVAADNLRLGRIVVVDCINPLASTRAAWRAVGQHAGVTVFEVEVICSDASEHRRRIERRSAEIARLTRPRWDEMMAQAYEPWAGERVVIDTAHRTAEACVVSLHARLLAHER